MKPRSLRMAGIGPFPDVVTIDFDHLDATGLFVVVGPTGAGKTTIFEAMAFALFAKVPSGRDLQSSFEHDKSFIEFVFTHNGQDHRVVREFMKNKTDFYEQLPTGTRVAQRRNVTQYIEELLKLTADQFMKLILLPQGKFQEFLIAKTSEKEDLLKKIFGTEVFDNVALQVRHYAAQANAELSEIERKIEIEDETVAKEIKAISDSYPEIGLDAELIEFEEVKRIIDRVLPGAHEASEHAAERVLKLSGQLAQSKALQRLYLDNELLKRLRAEIQGDATRTREAAEALVGHERAQRALRLLSAFEEASARVSAAKRQSEQMLSEIGRLLKDVSVNIPQVKTFRNSIGSARNLPAEFGIMSRAVKLAIDDLEEITELESDLTSARQAVEIFTKKISTADREVAALEAQSKELTRQRDTVNEQVSGLGKLQRQVNLLDSQIARADVPAAKHRLQSATKRLTVEKRALKSAQSKLDAGRSAHERHLAGLLAQQLSEAEACPVCGSDEHPLPATKTREVDIQSLIDHHASAKARHSQIEREIRDAKDMLRSTKQTASKLPSLSTQRQLRSRLKQAEQAAKNQKRVSKSLDAVTLRLTDARQSRADSVSHLSEANGTIKRLQKEIKKLRIGAPERVSDAQQRRTLHAITQLNNLILKRHRTQESLERDTAKVSTLESNLKSALKKESFNSARAASTALLRPHQIAALERTVETAKQRENDVLGLAARVEGQEIPTELPDFSGLEAGLQRERSEQQRAVARSTKLTSLSEALSRRELAMTDLLPQLDQCKNMLHETTSLEKAMNSGVGTGVDRVLALQEWIQRRLFVQVCRVASTQLRDLTSGRYTMTLDFDDDSAIKGAKGLDVYVVDSFNGKQRGVASLSGGETFLASLALALALAEVVQTHAGGIKIPCLFIDEGFGGLDQETLECAMDALLKLQNSGRSVGLVTHVETMQRQLPIGIRVHKGESGSRLEFPLLQ